MEDAPKPGDPNGERIVIRAPQSGRDGSTSDTGPSSGGPEGDTSRTSRASRTDADSKADLPMAVAVLGGILVCFAPLMPWWNQRIGMIELQEQITGVTTWPGMVCELSGAMLVGLCAYMISKLEVKLNVSVFAAGALALVVSLVALLAGKTLLGTTVELTPQVGLYLTVVGGTAGTVGGYMLMRKDSR